MAFLGQNDFLVTEKSTGRVKRVVNGAVRSVALDLAVNFASERGLLGIALHPDFRRNHWVYLFWTESSTGADTDVPAEGQDERRWAIAWTASSGTGRPKSSGTTGTSSSLRAYQADAGQPERGNHNGGVIRFARSDRDGHGMIRGDRISANNSSSSSATPDDVACCRTSWTVPSAPESTTTSSAVPNPTTRISPVSCCASMTTARRRATTRSHEYGASVGGEVGANLQKVFAYGIRNSFGLAVDPWTGELWESENCDDAFEEINRIEAGHNGGWVQAMGPLARVTEFKAIETTPEFLGLQQLRWPPDNIADSPAEARSRMVNLPGSHYGEPQFSWKYALPTAAIGFLENRSLGREYCGDLFVGAATPATSGGHIFRFDLTKNRQRLAWSDPVLADHGRRQRRQAQHRRKRIAAVRHRLRREHGHPDGPGRRTLCGLSLIGQHLRDSSRGGGQ